jgi:hypothetical protein
MKSRVLIDMKPVQCVSGTGTTVVSGKTGDMMAKNGCRKARKLGFPIDLVAVRIIFLAPRNLFEAVSPVAERKGVLAQIALLTAQRRKTWYALEGYCMPLPE